MAWLLEDTAASKCWKADVLSDGASPLPDASAHAAKNRAEHEALRMMALGQDTIAVHLHLDGAATTTLPESCRISGERRRQSSVLNVVNARWGTFEGLKLACRPTGTSDTHTSCRGNPQLNSFWVHLGCVSQLLRIRAQDSLALLINQRAGGLSGQIFRRQRIYVGPTTWQSRLGGQPVLSTGARPCLLDPARDNCLWPANQCYTSDCIAAEYEPNSESLRPHNETIKDMRLACRLQPRASAHLNCG